MASLTWEEVYEHLYKYIRYAAAVTESKCEGMYDKEDLYQEGLIKLMTVLKKEGEKPLAEFSAIFRKALWNRYKRVAQEDSRRKFVDKVAGKTVDGRKVGVSSTYELGDASYSKWLERVPDTYDLSKEVENADYDQYRYTQVLEILKGNHAAVSIFNEFVHPTTETWNECDKDDARKQTLKMLGHDVRFIQQSPDITKEHIKRSLKMPAKQYEQSFREVQDAVYAVYSRDTKIKKYNGGGKQYAAISIR